MCPPLMSWWDVRALSGIWVHDGSRSHRSILFFLHVTEEQREARSENVKGVVWLESGSPILHLHVEGDHRSVDAMKSLILRFKTYIFRSLFSSLSRRIDAPEDRDRVKKSRGPYCLKLPFVDNEYLMIGKFGTVSPVVCNENIKWPAIASYWALRYKRLIYKHKI